MHPRNITSIWPALLVAVTLAIASVPAAADCSLSKIVIVEGMPRSEVEGLVAKALGRASTYSAYANNLAGGIVEYRQAQCALKVTYLAGAPAPLISTPSGSVQHLAPKEETVVTYKLYLLSLPADSDTSESEASLANTL